MRGIHSPRSPPSFLRRPSPPFPFVAQLPLDAGLVQPAADGPPVRADPSGYLGGDGRPSREHRNSFPALALAVGTGRLSRRFLRQRRSQPGVRHRRTGAALAIPRRPATKRGSMPPARAASPPASVPGVGLPCPAASHLQHRERGRAQEPALLAREAERRRARNPSRLEHAARHRLPLRGTCSDLLLVFFAVSRSRVSFLVNSVQKNVRNFMAIMHRVATNVISVVSIHRARSA